MNTNGKTIIFLGDSITYGAGASAEDKCFAAIVAKNGAFDNWINAGVCGTRIAGQKDDRFPEYSETFIKRAMRLHSQADYVVVFGGTNDYGHGDAPIGKAGDKTPETFYGAFDQLLNYLMKKHQNAKIICITPLHRKNENSLINEWGVPAQGVLKQYVDAEREVCSLYGVPVLDLYDISGIYPDDEENCIKYTTDGLHPNDLGHKLIADKLLDFIKNL